ncbi:MAG: hypothetical protein ABEJ42_02730 [Halobacteriaceae archaeon]
MTADLTTFERADGDVQVAANGWPLYYYADDAAPGDATGQGAGDAWWVLAPDGTPRRSGSGSTTTADSTTADSTTSDSTSPATTTGDGGGYY